jgi:pyridoxamine 5'-phosphate oxidase
MNNDLWDIRRTYDSKPLREESMLENPLDQFAFWLDEVMETPILDPLAATLATVSSDGTPAARIILVKEVDTDGFIFYTNYGSQKADSLLENPKACLNFFWDIIHRQVRITGTIKKISREHSEKYFHSRPYESQIAAYISPQSKTVTTRTVLEENFHKAHHHFQGKTVPIPELWGGYKLIPTQFEFWQGLPSRLHDRIVYDLSETKWTKKRIAP